MTSIVDLPWLPAAPENFTKLCRQFSQSEGPAGGEAQALANYRLNPSQSGALTRAIAKRRKTTDNFSPLTPLRLGILSNATTDVIDDCIPAAALRHGVVVEYVSSPYDQVVQQALDPNSIVNTSKLDLVLLAVDHRWLQLDRPSLATADANKVTAALQKLRSVIQALRQNGVATILQTVPTPPMSLFGSFDRRVSGTVRAMIDEINRQIPALAAEAGGYILDVAALAERVGSDRWFDPVQWAAYKLPFASDVVPAYADMVGRLLGAVAGKARKCLVLDLDNTVWGGVIGDDGLEGIKIGQGSALGEAFLSVQHAALDLRERGIILAVSSKNDDAVARGPFRDHPDMALRESHISAFQANWSDKPSNLKAIAASLNIGVDALVFLDDNPVERAQVRAALPMVAVPELPRDPGWYAWYLAAAGYFESVAFSAEDTMRLASYATDAQRAKLLEQSHDLGDYLSSLRMEMEIAPFDVQGRQRITQLINKTNQFNLTTRRYKEGDVESFETDPSTFTMQVRLRDSYSDLGMIAVVICKSSETDAAREWRIDTWLMSCRVLGRRVEEAMLAHVLEHAKAHDVRRLIGTYIPTAKNSMVADLLGRLGFAMRSETADGVRTYELDVEQYVAPADLPFLMITTPKAPVAADWSPVAVGDTA
ncbi:MAG TPA: HAD-IIIC family phosphatase [Rhodoblastus sp.]|nr:HAD-IIIC family phosphatase [Rhodoblastus sp.]